MSHSCGRGWSKRCAHAVPGTKCRCKCGGANHGAMHAEATAQDLQKVAKSKRALWKVTGKSPRLYVLTDVGDDSAITLAEDAKRIVKQLAKVLGGRRLLFWDRAKALHEIVLEKRAFARIEPRDIDAIDLDLEDAA
jgi:hypothetical protein